MISITAELLKRSNKKEFSGTNLREPFKCRLTNIFYFIIYAEQQQTMFLRRYSQKHNDLFLLL